MSQILLKYLEKPPLKLNKQDFASCLIQWYQANKRDLPWRNTADPYKIWLSEIILQQTRVAQGLPYYQQFIAAYPTIRDLAEAQEEVVLRLWQGLGYYTRARNLHACARMVVSQFGGHFPKRYQDLLTLKGIGQYTAAAIASIAFKEPVPVVDGNVYRVLARIFGLAEDITSTKGKKVFYALAQDLIAPNHADDYNQAIMEFGAIQCTPKPMCTTCIFKTHCIALNTGKQKDLPVKKYIVEVKKRFFHYFVIQLADSLYMNLRKKGDIWQGLYDFYLVEDAQLKEAEELEDELVSLIKKHNLVTIKNPQIYKHSLTHRQLYVHFFHVQATEQFILEAEHLLAKSHSTAFVLKDTNSLPKPILICNFLKNNFVYAV